VRAYSYHITEQKEGNKTIADLGLPFPGGDLEEGEILLDLVVPLPEAVGGEDERAYPRPLRGALQLSILHPAGSMAGAERPQKNACQGEAQWATKARITFA
jgi:hypothetical protein